MPRVTPLTTSFRRDTRHSTYHVISATHQHYVQLISAQEKKKQKKNKRYQQQAALNTPTRRSTTASHRDSSKNLHEGRLSRLSLPSIKQQTWKKQAQATTNQARPRDRNKIRMNQVKPRKLQVPKNVLHRRRIKKGRRRQNLKKGSQATTNRAPTRVRKKIRMNQVTARKVQVPENVLHRRKTTISKTDTSNEDSSDDEQEQEDSEKNQDENSSNKVGKFGEKEKNPNESNCTTSDECEQVKDVQIKKKNLVTIEQEIGDNENPSQQPTETSKKRNLSNMSSEEEPEATRENGIISNLEKNPKQKRKYNRNQLTQTLEVQHKPLPDPKQFEKVANVCSGKVDLLTILPFIHQTPDDFFAQPEVNHRGINMKHIESALVPAAVTTNPYGASFEDEIFLIVYEIADTETDVHVKSVLPPFQEIAYAKAPTNKSVYELLQLLNMKKEVPTYFPQIMNKKEGKKPYTNPQLFLDLLQHKSLQFDWFDMDQYHFWECFSFKTKIIEEASDLKKLELAGDDECIHRSQQLLLQTARKIVQKKTNIRFAVYGGQHRIATAIQLLAEQRQHCKLYPTSKLFCNPTITIAMAQENQFDNEFIQIAKSKSNEIQVRPSEALKTSWSTPLLYINDDKQNRRERYFNPKQILTSGSTAVSKWIFCDFQN